MGMESFCSAQDQNPGLSEPRDWADLPPAGFVSMGCHSPDTPHPQPLTLASVFSTNQLLSNPHVPVALLTYRPQERLPDQA